ncbi:ABC transporter permease [Isobaculum melis]|uniref:ABC-2 family transporter protein n=1 Tax=Isobaculum melis TaxID=142588 RepID=A0A1H9TSW1_9LACT|nr:ABC transporter permease [Isobaculum melis]SES00144.1 ABC-2 family transporter protein [Isobaculum melis]
MMNIIKGEIKKVNVRGCLKMLPICMVLLLVFMYFFAGVSLAKPEEVKNNSEIGTYQFIYQMGTLLALCIFSVVSSIVNSRLIVEEYTTEKTYLLFSYPVNRKHLFLVKTIVGMVVSILLTIVGTGLTFILFHFSESLFSIVPDTFDSSLVLKLAVSLLIISVLAAMVGIFSMAIGLYKRSIAVTVSSAIVFAAVLSNMFVLDNLMVSLISVVAVCCIAVVVVYFQGNKINALEV